MPPPNLGAIFAHQRQLDEGFSRATAPLRRAQEARLQLALAERQRAATLADRRAVIQETAEAQRETNEERIADQAAAQAAAVADAEAREREKNIARNQAVLGGIAADPANPTDAELFEADRVRRTMEAANERKVLNEEERNAAKAAALSTVTDEVAELGIEGVDFSDPSTISDSDLQEALQLRELNREQSLRSVSGDERTELLRDTLQPFLEKAGRSPEEIESLDRAALIAFERNLGLKEKISAIGLIDARIAKMTKDASLSPAQVQEITRAALLSAGIDSKAADDLIARGTDLEAQVKSMVPGGSIPTKGSDPNREQLQQAVNKMKIGLQEAARNNLINLHGSELQSSTQIKNELQALILETPGGAEALSSTLSTLDPAAEAREAAEREAENNVSAAEILSGGSGTPPPPETPETPETITPTAPTTPEAAVLSPTPAPVATQSPRDATGAIARFLARIGPSTPLSPELQEKQSPAAFVLGQGINAARDFAVGAATDFAAQTEAEFRERAIQRMAAARATGDPVAISQVGAEIAEEARKLGITGTSSLLFSSPQASALASVAQ